MDNIISSLISSLIYFLTSSHVYRLLSWAISPMWHDPAGRIFLWTVGVTFIVYLIYGGYLFVFAGGASVFRLGIGLSDLITLPPVAILTIFNIVQEQWWPAIKWLFWQLLWQLFSVFMPIISGVFLGILMKSFLPSYFGSSDIIMQLGLMIYLSGFTASIFSSTEIYSKWQVVGIWAWQIFGIVLFTVGTPTHLAQPQQTNSFETSFIWVYYLNKILVEIFSVLFICIIPPILLILFGMEMAKIAVQQKALSQVLNLVLKQPLLYLGQFKQSRITNEQFESTNGKMSPRNRPVGKASFLIDNEPQVYIYDFDKEQPLYLVASFSDTLAFYRYDDESSPSGRLIIIDRQIMSSMVLKSSKIKSDHPLPNPDKVIITNNVSYEPLTNDNPKIVPSDEIINQLRDMAKNQDYRTYSHLIDQVDWQLASAESLDKTISVTLAFVDMERTKKVTAIGLERFPENEVFTRTWRLFNPRSARVVKTKWQSSPESLEASMKWLQQHVREYKPGYWLAVKAGQLIANAPNREEFDRAIEKLGGAEILAVNTIVHRVLK